MKNAKLLLIVGALVVVSAVAHSQNVTVMPGQSHQTAHFLIHYPRPLEGLARSIAGTLEIAFLTTCNQMGTRPFGDNVIYICDSDSDFRQFHPSVGDSWITGFAIPMKRKIVVRSPSLAKTTREQFIKTLRHEISHLVLHHAVGKNVRLLPRWFDEGMAMINAGQWEWLDSWSLFQMVIFSDPLPFSAIRDAFPSGASEARLAYAQSYNFCLFLQTTLKKQQFEALVAGMRSGIPLGTQLERLFGVPFAKIEKVWYERVRDRYGVYPFLTSAGVFWFLLTILMLVAYARKRRAARERLAEMEAEDEFIDHVLDGKYH
ncbi:MAG: hypothetical protein JW941_08310 [Candidatus Coatesbacteria bacterium]|nr:hypothetical protein [Candidatus Coatesbacteria bacterium]